MKNLKDICNVNIPNSLHSLLEGSLLADIEDTIETGNKYEKVDLTSIFNSKSKDEFETKFNIYRSMVEEKNTEVLDVKPRKTYIVFVKNISMKSNDPRLCRVSIFIGTTTYYIVGATATDEDYYYVGITKDRSIHFISAVAWLQVVEENLNDTNFSVWKYLVRHEPETIVKDVKRYIDSTRADVLFTKINIDGRLY